MSEDKEREASFMEAFEEDREEDWSEPETSEATEEESSQPEPEQSEAEPDTGETEAEPPSAETTDTEDEKGFVPRKAVLDERRKRQELERQVAELKAERESKERQPQPHQEQQQHIPDPEKDPAGYAQFVAVETQRQALSHRLDTSQMLAEQAHGEEVVKSALERMRSDPNRQALFSQFTGSRHPYDELVKWHNEQQAIEEIRQSGGIEAYRQRILEESNPSAQEAAPPPSKTPPPSIAGRGGKSKADAPVSADAFFDSVWD